MATKKTTKKNSAKAKSASASKRTQAETPQADVRDKQREKLTEEVEAMNEAGIGEPSDTLRVAITFPRALGEIGPTKFTARMSAAVAEEFVPAPETIERALEYLQKNGFVVTNRGQLTASVRCNRKDYEKLFGTVLAPFAQASEMPQARLSANAVYYPPEGAPWNPPAELSGLIDDAYIQWNHIYLNQRFSPTLPSPVPPRVNYHHLRVDDVVTLLNAAKVHRNGTTGKGVRVAMIDSGFAFGHPYFQERGYNTSVVLAPGATHHELDGNGHGTGESANLLAVAPDVTFIGIKLDNEEAPNNGASVLEGFQEALRHNPDVVSVSLGYDLCPTNPQTGRRISNDHLTRLPNGLRALEAEIAAAVASGIIVVFSAGNGHVSFPGMMPEVISAGGVYVELNGAMQASDYASAFESRIYSGRRVPDFCGLVGLAANHADYIMLPVQSGCEIDRGNSLHDGTSNNDGWGVFSGTSASAPQLAGVCALLLEKNPQLAPTEIKSILRRTCRDVVNGTGNSASNENRGGMPASGGDDGATGAGLVDAFAAWSQA
ncbi:MAG TPA: S8 family serine peptidase [Pyrinomonadaceae bacterium]|jgi:subtilisin family serine protease